MSALPRFDVFRVYPNGDVRWLNAVHSAEHAKRVIAVQEPGEYLILDHDTGVRTIVESGHKAAGGVK